MKNFKLDDEPKITSGFTTPDGYFDTLSDKVLAQIPASETKIIPISKSIKRWYYVAAAIVVLLLCVPMYTKFATANEEIDSATLENYIAYQSTISEDEIVDLLEQEDLDKMKLEFNLDDATIEETLNSNSNLEQYITD